MKKWIFMALLIPSNAFCAETDGGKFRIEASTGYQNASMSNGNAYSLGKGFQYGLELGYDFPISKSVTIGPFASYTYEKKIIALALFVLAMTGILRAEQN